MGSTSQELGQYIVDTSPPPQQFYEAPPATAQTYEVAPPPPEGCGVPAALTAVLIVLAVVLILYLVRQIRGRGDLGAALAARGWVLYTRPGCPACTRQMSALYPGSAGATYPRNVVCPAGAALGTSSDCKSVPAYPYWVNASTAETRVGLQDREQLRRMLSS